MEKELKNPIVSHSFDAANGMLGGGRFASGKENRASLHNNTNANKPALLNSQNNIAQIGKGGGSGPSGGRRTKAKVIVKSSLFPGATPAAASSTKATTFHQD